MKLIALAALSLTLFSQAEAAQTAKEKFCQQRLSSTNAIQKIVSSSENHLAFTNQGGLFGGGVCWWHSRFTRAAAYLAIFDPTLPPPSVKEAKDIITTIRKRSGVVTIPGFRNLDEFSRSFASEIQGKLVDWQRSDGLLKAAWVKGLSGNSGIDETELSQRMDDLFSRIQNGEVVFQKLQMPGPTAHAWLVVGMKPTTQGYKITVVDSNDYYGMTSEYNYSRTDRSIDYDLTTKTTHFVPYTEEVPEEIKLREKLEEECSKI